MGFEKRLPVTTADWKTNVQDKFQKFSDVCQARVEADNEQMPKFQRQAMLAQNPMLNEHLRWRPQQFTKNTTFPFH